MTTSFPSLRGEKPQTVLVLQGGGALGAYQFGVYQGLHEAGIEPDWVIGTSIGAINAALIAGNAPEHRLERMEAFWDRVTHRGLSTWLADVLPDWAHAQHKLEVVLGGLSGFFRPNWLTWGAGRSEPGGETPSCYSTQPLRETLSELLDPSLLARGPTRLTVGAVNVRTGQMRYFDSRHEAVGIDAVMASGALAPAFAAVHVDGESYWDGGLYSNSPIEVVLDEHPRRDALIFSAQLWRAEGPLPQSLPAMDERLKDIQFASRADSHIERQRQLHHLRHVVYRLIDAFPEEHRGHPVLQRHRHLACDTVMHVVKLCAPVLPGQDGAKDIDFSRQGIAVRHASGLATARAALESCPWNNERGLSEGMCVHQIDAVAR